MPHAIGLGTVLGIATRLVYESPDLVFIHRLGAPWLAAAFAIGALSRRPAMGSAYGAAGLVAAVISYYAFHPYPGSGLGLTWIFVAVPSGAVLGAAGAVWRDGGAMAPLAGALPIGALLGEAVFWFGRAHGPAFTLEVCLAAALVALLFRRAGQRAVALAAGVVVGLAVTATEVAAYIGLGYLVG